MSITATGGSITYSGDKTLHTFTSNGTFEVTAGSGDVTYFIVAGGGGGGGYYAGGGGGAGGVVTSVLGVTVNTYEVVIGAGGNGASDTQYVNGSNGASSSFSAISATGGGGGGAGVNNNGVAGGSGGGGGGYNSGTTHTGGAGTGTEGNAGGTSSKTAAAYGAGGGGGAGAVGDNGSSTQGGNGGAGTAHPVTAVVYAGGGGGGSAVTGGTGVNGGGNGADTGNGSNATANTGGGGGGSGAATRGAGGNGGSGIVIISYLTPIPTQQKLKIGGFDTVCPAVNDTTDLGTSSCKFKNAYLSKTLILAPSTEPASPIEGQLYYDSTGHVLYLYTGEAWKEFVTEGDLRLVSGSIQCTIDGGGQTITTGIKADVKMPYAGTITGWSLLSDVSGSIVIDVWKSNQAGYPPTVANTITGSEKPTLSSQLSNQDLTLTTWTTSFVEGDILRFNVDSVSICTRVHLSIQVTKT